MPDGKQVNRQVFQLSATCFKKKKKHSPLIPWCTIKNSNITQKSVLDTKGETHDPSIMDILIDTAKTSTQEYSPPFGKSYFQQYL